MTRGEQLDMWGGGESAEYDAFVEKFKPKKTTDDCYTPPHIYDAIADWVVQEYGVDRAKFVRPFYPGGDYQSFDYSGGAIVVDNPPFSIITQIKRWYSARDIPFFLFAPSLTLMSSGDKTCTYIAADTDITYENGACVRTGFITNMDSCLLRSAPTLRAAVKAAQKKAKEAQSVTLPKYAYPDQLITAAMVQRYSKYGIEYRLEKDEAIFVSRLDAQRAAGKSVYGGGFLTSERAAAERAAAIVWQLSEREREIVKTLRRDDA